MQDVTEIQKITLIGAGNVAVHLGRAFAAAGMEIVEVYSPNGISARELAASLETKHTTALDRLESSDLYLIAVPDDSVAEVLSMIDPQKKFLVHTSGSLSMDIFSGDGDCGVFYPLQTFSKTKPVDVASIPICIEARTDQLAASLKYLAQKISNRIEFVPSHQRRILHLAAVFACNFPNFMYAQAERIVHEANLDFDLLKPLILETADKVQSMAPRLAQTGPALRGDQSILNQQLSLLEKYPDIRELYRMISDSIGKMNKKNE